MKKLFTTLLISMFILFTCIQIDTQAAVKLNQTSVTINVKETFALKLNKKKKKVKWSSSEKSVATVSTKGVVTGLKKGNATITAKCGKKKYKCKVTVKQPVTKITLKTTSAKMHPLDCMLPKATVSPANANNKELIWESSDVYVARVENEKGLIQGIGTGDATITCRSADNHKVVATCKVSVSKYPIPALTKERYTVSPSSKPYGGAYTKNHNYNSKTKHYFLLQSYMDAFEKYGGGTLVLKAGSYRLSNTVYVPSNVHVIMEDGVVLEKIIVKDGSEVESASMFQLIPLSYITDEPKKVSRYNGDHDITFEGKGKVVIDLKKQYKTTGTGALAFVLGHCKNIEIKGIRFQNMHPDNHFIELNSSANVSIENCSFYGNVTTGVKEAINIDSTDLNTRGFNNDWSTHDRTCTTDVTIRNNTFKNLMAGIGTHKYSCTDKGTQLYHKNVVIENNTFDKVGSKARDTSPIRMANWKDAKVCNNIFQNVPYYAIKGYGVDNPVVEGNSFAMTTKEQRTLLFRTGVNTGGGSHYPKSPNKNLSVEKIRYNKTSGTKEFRVYNDDNSSYKNYTLIDKR